MIFQRDVSREKNHLNRLRRPAEVIGNQTAPSDIYLRHISHGIGAMHCHHEMIYPFDTLNPSLVSILKHSPDQDSSPRVVELVGSVDVLEVM